MQRDHLAVPAVLQFHFQARQRLAERFRRGLGAAKQVKCEPFGGFGSDTWELTEFFYGLRDLRGEKGHRECSMQYAENEGNAFRTSSVIPRLLELARDLALANVLALIGLLAPASDAKLYLHKMPHMHGERNDREAFFFCARGELL